MLKSLHPYASFRNEGNFYNCGPVSSLHIQRRILSFFYLVAHNFYDVLLILLVPPYIDFSQLSALSVFKNAS